MKLRTSFFNPGVLKKDLTRFAPLWGLYTIFTLFYVFLAWEDNNSAAAFARDASNIMQAMGVVNFCYAGLCALLLYGDLFTARLTNALHAMPLRREGWFLTHLAAGMLFCLVPNSLGAVVAAMALGQYAYLAYIWLGLMVLQFICFFGLGAFSVQCAGSRLGAAAVYGITNFLSVLVTWLVQCFYEPMLYGITMDTEKLMRYSPVIGFCADGYVAVEYDYGNSVAIFNGFVPEAWRYLFIAAAVGVGLLGLSVVLYRRRSLESAGDLIAFRPAAPVFLILYTLCAGAVMYVVAEAVSSGLQYVFMILGFAIGFFTGWMLLEKKVNVFRPRKLIGFGLTVFVFFLSVTLVWLDPIGITRYVPQSQQVETVTVSPYASRYYRDQMVRTLTDPADIDAVTQLHRALVKTRGTQQGGTTLRLQYKLKNGTTVERQYQVDPQSQAGQTLKTYYSSMDLLFGGEDPAQVLARAKFVEFNSYNDLLPTITISTDAKDLYPQEGYDKDTQVLVFEAEGSLADDPRVKGLMEALEADCREGDMAPLWDYHKNADTFGYLVIRYDQDRYSTKAREITVFSDCYNTVNYLLSLTKEG